MGHRAVSPDGAGSAPSGRSATRTTGAAVHRALARSPTSAQAPLVQFELRGPLVGPRRSASKTRPTILVKCEAFGASAQFWYPAANVTTLRPAGEPLVSASLRRPLRVAGDDPGSTMNAARALAQSSRPRRAAVAAAVDGGRPLRPSARRDLPEPVSTTADATTSSQLNTQLTGRRARPPKRLASRFESDLEHHPGPSGFEFQNGHSSTQCAAHGMDG